MHKCVYAIWRRHTHSDCVASSLACYFFAEFIIALFQEITCKVGCGTVQDIKCGSHAGTKFGRSGEMKDGKTQSESKAKSLWSKMTFRKSVTDSSHESGSDVNAVIGGIPACIGGQFGEVIVFMEPLLDAQVQSLFKLGKIVILLLFVETETETATVSRLLCLYINSILPLLLLRGIEVCYLGTSFMLLNWFDAFWIHNSFSYL